MTGADLGRKMFTETVIVLQKVSYNLNDYFFPPIPAFWGFKVHD